MSDNQQHTMLLGELARKLDVRMEGDEKLAIRAVSSIKSARADNICFLQSPAYLKELMKSDCGAVIVPEAFDQTLPGKCLLFAGNPHLMFVRTIHLLESMKKTVEVASIHPSALIDPSAQLGAGVSIGANCVIGEGVKIEDGVTVHCSSVIENDCVIGANTLIHPRVTICHEVTIGTGVILHPGVVIGSDGFGLVYDEGSWVKIPHLGSVIIGDEVEIGANTTVDRGALDDTIIEKGAKLDNLIQVAHNVVIGENTAIAGCVGIAGSAIIGKNCKISGAAVVLGHLSIADNVTITAMSLVTRSIPESGTYSSGTPLMENRLWHRNNARYKSLDKLVKRISSLEKNN